MKIRELRQQTEGALQAHLDSLIVERQKTRFDLTSKKIHDVKKLHKIKKEIAAVKTIQTERNHQSQKS